MLLFACKAISIFNKNNKKELKKENTAAGSMIKSTGFWRVTMR